MFPDTDVSLDCRTCVAANTTACQDCVVQHLLANDAGPIEFVPVAQPRAAAACDSADSAIEMFARAGLIDSPVTFVAWSDFESVRVPEMTG